VSRIVTRRSLLLFVSVLAAGSVAGACGPAPAPDMPTFAHDVEPIMLARCVRCHGAGGMLNADPHSTVMLFQGAPTSGYFDHLEDQGDCVPDGGVIPMSCKRGLKYYATDTTGVALWKLWFPMMPPAPAPKLSDRQLDTINRWVKNPLP
jgi:hypothetical protein